MVEETLDRYLVRRGTNLWMIWDRKAKGPAVLNKRPLTILDEEHARKLCAELNGLEKRHLEQF